MRFKVICVGPYKSLVIMSRKILFYLCESSWIAFSFLRDTLSELPLCYLSCIRTASLAGIALPVERTFRGSDFCPLKGSLFMVAILVFLSYKANLSFYISVTGIL